MKHYHPPIQENESVSNLVWRDHQKTRPLPISSSLKRSYNSTGFTSHEESSQGVEPLSGGSRGSNPWQDPNDLLYQKIQMKPYSIPKGGDYDCLEQPFYHVNFLASAGGFPLKIAMDEPGQLNMMVHNEKMRIHPSNPLSAAYATRVIQELDQDPLRGPLHEKIKQYYEKRKQNPMYDPFRRNVSLHTFDDGTVSRRNQAMGGDVHHPDMVAWMRGRPPSSRVPHIGGMEALFNAPPQNIAVNPILARAHEAVMAQVQNRNGHRNNLVAANPSPALNIGARGGGVGVIDRTPHHIRVIPRVGGGARPSGSGSSVNHAMFQEPMVTPRNIRNNRPFAIEPSNTPINSPLAASLDAALARSEERRRARPVRHNTRLQSRREAGR